MIYLILDTNIWLYLANGHDPFNKNNNDKLHFELLTKLKEHCADNDIKILVNDIIILEWNRNKEVSKARIKKLNNILRTPESIFNTLKKYVSSDIEGLKKEYLQGVKDEIKQNETHLKEVEDFLMNQCISIKVSDEVKLKIFNQSINNQAPFHNNKNNVADASILFCSAEHLKDKLNEDNTSAIFVSNNYTDFAESSKSTNFHPEILTELDDIDIKYQRVLPSALELSQEIITQIADYNYQNWIDSMYFSCQTDFCGGNENLISWGYLDGNFVAKTPTEKFRNPNQIDLFPDYPKLKKPVEVVRIGGCLICETIHIDCPVCDDLTYCDNEEDYIRCTSCNTKMVFDYDDESPALIIYKNE